MKRSSLDTFSKSLSPCSPSGAADCTQARRSLGIERRMRPSSSRRCCGRGVRQAPGERPSGTRTASGLRCWGSGCARHPALTVPVGGSAALRQLHGNERLPWGCPLHPVEVSEPVVVCCLLSVSVARTRLWVKLIFQLGQIIKIPLLL